MGKEGVFVHVLKLLHYKIAHLSEVYGTLPVVPTHFSSKLQYDFVLNGAKLLSVYYDDQFSITYFDHLIYDNLREEIAQAIDEEVVEHHRFKKQRIPHEFHTTAQVDIGKQINLGNYLLTIIKGISPAYNQVRAVKEAHGEMHTWRIYVHGKHGRVTLLDLDLSQWRFTVKYMDSFVEEAVHNILYVNAPKLFPKKEIRYVSAS